MDFSDGIEVDAMATVNFISYRTQCFATLKSVIDYVSQAKKVSISKYILASKHEKREQISKNSEADEVQLISGINCTPEIATHEFLSTKESYNKNSGVQFYHYTQSFQDDENISPQTAHEIALKFAEENYKDFEVLVATHMDNDHLHSHFIINSVSFATGKKLHQPPDTLRKLRASSDNLCKEFGLDVLEPYSFGRSKTFSRAEQRANERGNSWKYELCLSIEKSMRRSKTRQEFIADMERQGYGVAWNDKRKSITYTTPNGRKCRDNKLYGDKYTKQNMELEFKIREENLKTSSSTGWEFERKTLLKPVAKPVGNPFVKELLLALRNLENAENHDDEIAEMLQLGMLTALSAVGIYMLIQKINEMNISKLTDDTLIDTIVKLQEIPENQADFEEEIIEEDEEFTMTM